mgnify:FL=1
MTQTPKDLPQMLIELSEYEGVDKVITSFDMKGIIAQQPKIVPVMSKMPLLDRLTGGFCPGEL